MKNQAVEPPQNYRLNYLVVKRKNLPCFIFLLKIQLVNRGKIIRANVSGRKSYNLSNEIKSSSSKLSYRKSSNLSSCEKTVFRRVMVAHNVGNMAWKGLRRTSLSRYNEIDAGDELRIPIMPFLAILRVMRWNFLFSLLF